MSAIKRTVRFFCGGFGELRDPVLRYFGVSLALAHLLSVAFYIQKSAVEIISAPLAVCWPFLPNCFLAPAWSENFTNEFFVVYALAAAISALLFLSNRPTAAWCCSLLTLILKVVISLRDYRLMGNYHYMIYVVHFLFLFYPRKRTVIPLMIVAIYVSAGSLKFNLEWLSGAALLKEPLAKGWLLVATCTYVVVLEMIFSFGLLARNRKIFVVSLAQFLVFHAVSYGQVGFFYPSVMFCLLAIFYLPLLLKPQEVFIRQKVSFAVVIPVAVFALAQVAPFFFRGDSSITGQGRMFSLNMFDARSECLISEIARFDKASVETNPVFQFVRIRCDPVSVVGLERARCQSLKQLPGFKDLDVYMNTKKHSGDARPVLRIENFCQRNIEFSIWKNNEYIL